MQACKFYTQPLFASAAYTTHTISPSHSDFLPLSNIYMMENTAHSE